MKKRKSILALSLVVVIGVGLLCGCGKTEPTSTESSTASASTATETENVETESVVTEQPAEESVSNSGESSKASRIVEYNSTSFYSDGTLKLAKSETFDYEAGLVTIGYKYGSSSTDEDVSSNDWEYATYSFTYDGNRTLNIDLTNGYYSVSSFWDNWLVKTSTTYICTVEGEMTQSWSFNEYRLKTKEYNSRYYNLLYNYDYLEFEEINGNSFPTYAYVTFSSEKDSSTEVLLSYSYIEISYDSKGNVIQQTYQNSSGQTIGCMQYEYNSSGNLTRITDFEAENDGSLSLYCITEYTYE
jgi:hypothetical protein